MPAGEDRRSPAQAGDRPNHDFYDFAQEFQRRNADYRRGYARLMRSVGNAAPDDERNSFCAQWGLVFPV